LEAATLREVLEGLYSAAERRPGDADELIREFFILIYLTGRAELADRARFCIEGQLSKDFYGKDSS
jgi:hypothetical protein